GTYQEVAALEEGGLGPVPVRVTFASQIRVELADQAGLPHAPITEHHNEARAIARRNRFVRLTQVGKLRPTPAEEITPVAHRSRSSVGMPPIAWYRSKSACAARSYIAASSGCRRR